MTFVMGCSQQGGYVIRGQESGARGQGAAISTFDVLLSPRFQFRVPRLKSVANLRQLLPKLTSPGTGLAAGVTITYLNPAGLPLSAFRFSSLLLSKNVSPGIQLLPKLTSPHRAWAIVQGKCRYVENQQAAKPNLHYTHINTLVNK